MATLQILQSPNYVGGLKTFFYIAFVQFKAEVRESLLNATTQSDGINIDQDLLRSCVEVFPVMGLSSKCTTLKTVQPLNTQPDLSVYESDLEIHS